MRCRIWVLVALAIAAGGVDAGQDSTHTYTDGLQVSRFLHAQHDNLARDFAMGGGDYADAFAELFGIAPRERPVFYSLMKRHYMDLFGRRSFDAQQFVIRVVKVLSSHNVAYRPTRQ